MAVILSVMVFSVLADDTSEKYPAKYDNVDVDAILTNSRLRNQYVRCIEGNGPCITAEAKFLREVLPEVLVTKCAKCTPKQQEFFDKVITWFDENDKETWNNVVSKVIEKYQSRDRRN